MAKIVAECTHENCYWGPVERDASARNNPEKRVQTKADRHEEMTRKYNPDGEHKVRVELRQEV